MLARTVMPERNPIRFQMIIVAMEATGQTVIKGKIVRTTLHTNLGDFSLGMHLYRTTKSTSNGK